MKDIKVLFIPDVHCRDFWKKPVYETLENNPNAIIVFLGDYLDGYPIEWDIDFDYTEHGFENFKEILNLKEKYKDRIILLLGNHDCTYRISTDICDCRRDRTHYQELTKLFEENKNKFSIAYEKIINNIHFVFSHAGITLDWLKYNKLEEFKDNIVDFLNNVLLVEDEHILNLLGQYDTMRGWGGYPFGSPVWGDIRKTYNLTKEESIGDFQIVGHTRLNTNVPLVFDYIGDFDCRETFYIDSNGIIRFYNDDKPVEKTK